MFGVSSCQLLKIRNKMGLVIITGLICYIDQSGEISLLQDSFRFFKSCDSPELADIYTSDLPKASFYLSKAARHILFKVIKIRQIKVELY